PLRVALGEVVVDRDEMDALALEGVQVAGKGGDEGLALSRPHLRDRPAVKRGTPHELDVEVPLADRAARRLSGDGEGLRKEIVEGLTVLEALPELDGLVGELLVGELLGLRLPRVDELSDLLELLATPAFTD